MGSNFRSLAGMDIRVLYRGFRKTHVETKVRFAAFAMAILDGFNLSITEDFMIIPIDQDMDGGNFQ